MTNLQGLEQPLTHPKEGLPGSEDPQKASQLDPGTPLRRSSPSSQVFSRGLGLGWCLATRLRSGHTFRGDLSLLDAVAGMVGHLAARHTVSTQCRGFIGSAGNAFCGQ